MDYPSTSAPTLFDPWRSSDHSDSSDDSIALQPPDHHITLDSPHLASTSITFGHLTSGSRHSAPLVITQQGAQSSAPTLPAFVPDSDYDSDRRDEYTVLNEPPAPPYDDSDYPDPAQPPITPEGAHREPTGTGIEEVPREFVPPAPPPQEDPVPPPQEDPAPPRSATAKGERPRHRRRERPAPNTRSARSFWKFTKDVVVALTPNVLMLPGGPRYAGDPQGNHSLPLYEDTAAQRVIFDRAMEKVMKHFPAPEGCRYRRLDADASADPSPMIVLGPHDRLFKYKLDCAKTGHREEEAITELCSAPTVKVAIVASLPGPAPKAKAKAKAKANSDVDADDEFEI